MSVRLSTVAGLAALVAACAPARRPALAPAPAAEPASGVAGDSAALSSVELAARVTALFGTALDPDSAAPAPVDVAGPTWDIDVRSYETHERVAYYVARFTGPSRGWMAERLRRGTRYDPMIRRKLRASGLPEDLAYLALIESGYSPYAYSRVGAAGLWQLMPETARDGGLRVDGWVDERRDPVRSTEAAIRFLRWLDREFGSMYLAVAAYNGGPGRIARGLTRFAHDMEGSTGDGFFTLAAQDYLPRETKEYVPQLIAAALVGKEPARYGIPVRPEPEFAYDSVRVPALTPLASVASASGSSVAEILDLNPHYLRGLVPPGSGATVRVPVGRGDGFADAFAALPADARRGVTRVETKKKQTLADLARATGRSPELLAAFNPGLAYGKKKRLLPGQTVLVPTATVAAAARAMPASPARSARSAAAPLAKGGSEKGGSDKRGSDKGDRQVRARTGTTAATVATARGARRATPSE
ncbi:MAG: GH23, partial [uncultured Gemmatimonadaceae bacterium]